MRGRYFALISNVFPPQNIRDQVASSSSGPSTSSTDTSSLYASAAHKTGVDMNIDPKTARAEDDPDEYLYTLQLMDEEGKFEGSTMEVKHRSLSCVPFLPFPREAADDRYASDATASPSRNPSSSATSANA